MDEKEQPAQQWIVVSGNIGDGFTFYGPFASYEDAHQAAEDGRQLSDGWHITDLLAPSEMP